MALGDAERGLATIRQARDLAAELGDVHEVARAWTSLAGALSTAFRWDEAADAGRGAAAYASRHGLAARLAPIALMWTAQALYRLGRWDEAVEVLNQAQRYELHGYYEVDLEAQLLAMEAKRGQFEAANRRRPRVLQLMERFPSGWTAALADLALLQGDPRAARAAVVSSMARPDIPDPYLGWGLRSGIEAEADLAALARSRHSEADLAESRAIGADLLERMRAVLKDLDDSPSLLHTTRRRSARCLRSRVLPPRRDAGSRSLGFHSNRLGGAPDSSLGGRRTHARGRGNTRAPPRPAESGARPGRGTRHRAATWSAAPSPRDREARG